MASTLSNAALTVTVTENITLNGSNHGSTKQMTISGINEIQKRIMTCATGGTQIYAGGSAVSYGTFTTSDVKYVRITNLDSENYIILHLEGNSHYAQIRLDAGHIFMLTRTSSTFDNNSAVASFSAEDITRIDAMANTAAVDIELLVASA